MISPNLPLPAAPLAVTVVSDAALLEPLRPAWADLLAQSRTNEPMAGPTWLLTWWQQFGPQDGRRPCFVLFKDGRRLVGLAPLLRRRHRYSPGIPFERLEFLGSGERDRDRICSDYLSILAEAGREEQVARALTEGLVAGTLGRWDELVLPMMNGEGPWPALLTAALEQASIPCTCRVADTAPYIPLPATWEAYLKALSSSQRYLITRSLRDFERWAAGTARLTLAGSPAELTEGTRVLYQLHCQRWQDDGQDGRFESPWFRAFHEAVLPRLHAEGALELLWLCAHGEPVAVLYNLVSNGKVSFYQCGRQTRLPRAIRPGIVILAHAIRRAIEAGRREFDFLGGLCQYKGQLALAGRPLVELRAARPCLVERVRCLVGAGKQCARLVRQVACCTATRCWTFLEEEGLPNA